MQGTAAAQIWQHRPEERMGEDAAGGGREGGG